MTEHRQSAVAKKKRTRRRHPARSARLLTAGLSSSAVLGLTALMGAAAPTWTQPVDSQGIGQATPVTPKHAAGLTAKRPKVKPVVVVVHRTKYVTATVGTTREGTTASTTSGSSGSRPSSTVRSSGSSQRTRAASSGSTVVPKAKPAPKPPVAPPQPADPPASHGGSGGSG